MCSVNLLNIFTSFDSEPQDSFQHGRGSIESKYTTATSGRGSAVGNIAGTGNLYAVKADQLRAVGEFNKQ